MSRYDVHDMPSRPIASSIGRRSGGQLDRYVCHGRLPAVTGFYYRDK